MLRGKMLLHLKIDSCGFVCGEPFIGEVNNRKLLLNASVVLNSYKALKSLLFSDCENLFLYVLTW